MTTKHRHTEPLTPEEDTEARLQQFEERDHTLFPAFESKGVRIASRGYDFVVLNPELLGLEPLSTDDEHRELSLPRVSRRGLYLPANGQTLTPLEVCDRWMKTPAKKREFLQGCTRKPELPRHIAIETGTDFERRGIATTEDMALRKAAATPNELVRALLVDCRDEKLAAEIVEGKRDSLPWCEDLKLRDDGTLPIGWHGLPLNRVEQRLLKDQSTWERALKRKRLEKLTRQMLRESA